jgi:hypothetical protein
MKSVFGNDFFGSADRTEFFRIPQTQADVAQARLLKSTGLVVRFEN